MNPTTLANLGALAGDLYGQLAAALEEIGKLREQLAEFEKPTAE